MKKIIIVLGVLALLLFVPIYIAYAGYGIGAGFNLKTRLEVSADNATWVNYLAEDNSGGDILTVSPGDTIYLRLKTWNEGGTAGEDTTFTGTFTNQQYLTNSTMFTGVGGGSGDLDEDGLYGYAMTGGGYNSVTGIAEFLLTGVVNGSTDEVNFQTGGITSEISASTPDQTLITVTVIITGTNPELAWLNRLLPRAYADEFGTTEVRILVDNPPADPTPTPTPTPSASATDTSTAASSNQTIVTTLPVTGPDLAD